MTERNAKRKASKRAGKTPQRAPKILEPVPPTPTPACVTPTVQYVPSPFPFPLFLTLSGYLFFSFFPGTRLLCPTNLHRSGFWHTPTLNFWEPPREPADAEHVTTPRIVPFSTEDGFMVKGEQRWV